MASPRNATLHLYRHLLREASYLPPACRPFISGRIRTLFHRHRHDPVPSTPALYRPLLSPPSATSLTNSRIKNARRALRTLRAANNGDIARMRRVLLLAFGRVGPRRRELIGRLIHAEPPANSAELTERLRDATTSAGSGAAPNVTSSGEEEEVSPKKLDWLDRWDTAKLHAFVETQVKAHSRIVSSPRPEIRSGKLDPAIHVPKENAWGLPLHPTVVRTKTKKWWKSLINRVLPPVDKAEWELLERLAAGNTSRHDDWEVPTRRIPAQAWSPIIHEGGGDQRKLAWDWQAYTRQPVRAVDRRYSRRAMAIMTGSERKDAEARSAEARSSTAPIGLRHLTSRLWRRLYAQIWQMTATMEKRPPLPDGVIKGSGKTRGQWDIRWGGSHFQPPTAAAWQAELFDGVDTRGKPVQPS